MSSIHHCLAEFMTICKELEVRKEFEKKIKKRKNALEKQILSFMAEEKRECFKHKDMLFKKIEKIDRAYKPLKSRKKSVLNKLHVGETVDDEMIDSIARNLEAKPKKIEWRLQTKKLKTVR